ncbi:MAG: hypothetical protein M0P01_09045 [Treponema sp.]|nr:hypothetical protein [Treponema sp.]
MVQSERQWGRAYPRSAYADFVRYMHAGGVACVLCDILYTEPSVYGRTDDENFAGSCADYVKVV